MYYVNNLREFLSLKKKDNYLNDGKSTLVCVYSSFIFSLKFLLQLIESTTYFTFCW